MACSPGAVRRDNVASQSRFVVEPVLVARVQTHVATTRLLRMHLLSVCDDRNEALTMLHGTL